MVDRLWVFLSGQRVGSLEDLAGDMQFTCEPGIKTPLSVNLPIRTQPYDNAACRPFFGNLLPEGSWRQATCRQLRIDENNDFQLLVAIGTECAGAVSLHPDSQWTPSKGSYAKTTETEIRNWMLNPASRPNLLTTPGLRRSLAGAQDKLLLHLQENTPYLCEGGAPSTVILKPDIKDALNAIELSAFNELLSVRLARKCGINVVDAFWYAAAYAVRRYDRIPLDGVWERLHQEDFAQIAVCPPQSGTKSTVSRVGWPASGFLTHGRRYQPHRDSSFSTDYSSICVSATMTRTPRISHCCTREMVVRVWRLPTTLYARRRIPHFLRRWQWPSGERAIPEISVQRLGHALLAIRDLACRHYAGSALIWRIEPKVGSPIRFRRLKRTTRASSRTYIQ